MRSARPVPLVLFLFGLLGGVHPVGGQTIDMLYMAQAGYNPSDIQDRADAFEEETDVTVRLHFAEYEDQYNLIMESMEKRVADYDVILLDLIWTADFAERRIIDPIPPSLQAEVESEMVPEIYSAFEYGNQIWALPFLANFKLFYTNMALLPRFEITGFDQYVRLFTEQQRWLIAMRNLVVFSALYISISVVIGLILAILLDQRIRAERLFQTVYLYPMALSFIVTGTIWKWILNPSLGIERLVREFGFSEFTFRWLVDRDMAIYTLVIAAVWQAAGYIMSLFLAGLRGIDSSIPEAAKVDGAGLPRIYYSILIPMLRPVFMSSVIVPAHLAIKSFDLVVVLTQGGPGVATDMPATFMYDFSFKYDRLAMGAASAVIMFIMVMAFVIPYLLSELRGTRDVNY